MKEYYSGVMQMAEAAQESLVKAQNNMKDSMINKYI